jgi:autotransporter translocation and assembly factor TamB
MTRPTVRRIFAAGAVAVLIVTAVVIWQFPALARIVAGVIASNALHANVSFERVALTTRSVELENARVLSTQGEPVATIDRIAIEYGLRDLLPGSKRLFGLRSVAVYSPRLTLVRHRDGTYNVPVPQLPAPSGRQGTPLVTALRIVDGSVSVVDDRRPAASNSRLYATNVEVDADVSTVARSTYRVAFGYGEGAGRLYPVRGLGKIDAGTGSMDQHWTAPALPISGAVDFLLDSPTLSLRAGTLHQIDARYFALPAESASAPQLAVSAMLEDGRIAIQGLAQPVEGVRGPIDAYEDGLLTPQLDATLARVPVRVSGGIYDLRHPRIRMAVRGSGDLARLRAAFTAARRLPVNGPLAFTVLVAGDATQPMTWVDLKSPRVVYASTPVDRVKALVGFDGKEADIVSFEGAYRGAVLGVRGRASLHKTPGAVDVMLALRAPPDSVPYAGDLLPNLPLRAFATATSDDPTAIGARGVLWGSNFTQRADALFDVDQRGVGSVGPLRIGGSRGTLYARVALDRPHNLALGLVRARGLAIPKARAVADADFFGGRTAHGIGADGTARVASAWGDATAAGAIGLQNGTLEGAVTGTASDAASFGAVIAGTPSSPRVSGTVAVAGGRYRDFDVSGTAGVAYADGTLRVHDAALMLGPAFVGVSGAVRGLSIGGALRPQYDLSAQVRTSDAGTLLAVVQPRTAGLVAGSVDADVRISGQAATPAVNGTFDAPEGSVNGLAFRDLKGNVRGNTGAIAVTGASVLVGTTALGFDANVAGKTTRVAVSGPQTDLADFNDFFDTGDTLSGVGAMQLQATLQGEQVTATSGTAEFARARYRRLDLGTVAAQWQNKGDVVNASVQSGGKSGNIGVTGTVATSSRTVNLNGTASGLDLAMWLPMLDIPAPVTGKLDARAHIAGRYPDLAMNVHAAVFNGTLARLPVERFEITASADHGRGTISSAVLSVPSLTTQVSGAFGLRASDPLALVAHTTSPDVGAFLVAATGKNFQVSGALDSTLRINGTRSDPRLSDTVTVQSARYQSLTIPRIAGTVDVTRRAATIRYGEVDLEKGKATFSAVVPIDVTSSAIRPASGPITAELLADDVELSNFNSLLPKDAQIGGRIDGKLAGSGTVSVPQLSGSLRLTAGAFKAPEQKSPMTGIAADLTFSGNQAHLQSSTALGGGTLNLAGTASFASLRRPAETTANLVVSAQNARLDVSPYFRGNVNGNVTLTRSPVTGAVAGGDITLSQTRISLGAFLGHKSGGDESSQFPAISFSGLKVTAARDVRIQDANVDVGATGSVTVDGALPAPKLTGTFDSTGGTLSFYRTFTVERAQVAFSPGSGFIPDVNAKATTFVTNPDTAIGLQVTGPATSMQLALTSEPEYSRQQILGLLVGAQQFGAVQGVQSTGGGAFSLSSAAANVALGQLDTLFTRNLLQPLSSSMAEALGFTNVSLTAGLQSGVGVSAMKAFGKNVNAIFAQTFGYPRIQSITLDAHPSVSTGLRLTAFTATGPTLLSLQQPVPVTAGSLNVNPLTSLPVITGNNGITFAFQRKFPW